MIPGLGRSPGEGKGYPLWPGEFHELYDPGGHKESDVTEQLISGYIPRNGIAGSYGSSIFKGFLRDLQLEEEMTTYSSIPD